VGDALRVHRRSLKAEETRWQRNGAIAVFAEKNKVVLLGKHLTVASDGNAHIEELFAKGRIVERIFAFESEVFLVGRGDKDSGLSHLCHYQMLIGRHKFVG
jgi:hypothetical protein